MTEICCTPIAAGLDREEAEQTASLFKVLADPARLQILSMLMTSGEVCVCDFVEPLDLSQPTVSHHLKQLREAGFVSSERRGKWIYHSLRKDRLDEMRAVLTTRVWPPVGVTYPFCAFPFRANEISSPLETGFGGRRRQFDQGRATTVGRWAWVLGWPGRLFLLWW